MPLQLRRGTTAERLSIVPLPGEPIYDTDLNTVFIGNGIAAGGISAITGITSEDAQDIVGQMFLNGQHDGLIFTYGSTQDVANRIDVRLDLSSYDGELAASAFRGSLYANDSTLLVNADTGIINASAISGTFGGPVAASQMTTAILNADNMFGILTGDMIGSVFSDSSTLLVNGVDGSINLDGTVKGDIIPAGNELYDLGSNSNRFKDLYLSGSSIFLGNATITSTGSAVNLPVGSTINGTPIGTGTGTGDGVVAGSNYNINIIGDDSSVIVNSSNNTISGNIFTNLVDTLDSSSITFIPAVSMNSDLIVENDLVVSNSVTANLFTGRVAGPVYSNLFADDDNIIINYQTKDITVRNILSQGIRIRQDAGDPAIRLERINVIGFLPSPVIQGDRIGSFSCDGFNGIQNITGTRILSTVESSSLGSGMPSALSLQVNSNVDSLETYFKVDGTTDSVTAFRPLSIFDDTYRTNIFAIYQAHDTVDASNISIFRSRGSTASKSAVISGDDIVDISFLGWNGSSFNPAISMSVVVPTALTGANVPGKIIIRTNNGTTGTVERLSIDHLGNINATGTLNVVGNANISGNTTTDLIGSIFSNTSSLIIDATDSSLMIANVNFKGETGNTPSDSVTVDSWLELSVNGVTKYIPLYD